MIFLERIIEFLFDVFNYVKLIDFGFESSRKLLRFEFAVILVEILLLVQPVKSCSYQIHNRINIGIFLKSKPYRLSDGIAELFHLLYILIEYAFVKIMLKLNVEEFSGRLDNASFIKRRSRAQILKPCPFQALERNAYAVTVFLYIDDIAYGTELAQVLFTLYIRLCTILFDGKNRHVILLRAIERKHTFEGKHVNALLNIGQRRIVP